MKRRFSAPHHTGKKKGISWIVCWSLWDQLVLRGKLSGAKISYAPKTRRGKVEANVKFFEGNSEKEMQESGCL